MRRRWHVGMFDFDGTLWNSKMLNYGSMAAIFQSFELPVPSMEEFVMTSSIRDLMDFYRAHGVPQSATRDQLRSIKNRYFEVHWKEAPLFDGTFKLLRICRELGMLTAIVSGQDREWLTRVLTERKISAFFDDIHGSVRGKEDALVQPLDYFGVKAEDAFYLDDTREGLTAAKDLGITAIGITHGLHKRALIEEARPDFIVDSLFEVIELLLAQ
ncbi:MAG: HAD hydrolase-like protein [Candidatus Liptonbacteria bacterium]|nr:HAD hydrolase-like protein [Candidatus Liptonbacteria bacterium]